MSFLRVSRLNVVLAVAGLLVFIPTPQGQELPGATLKEGRVPIKIGPDTTGHPPKTLASHPSRWHS